MDETSGNIPKILNSLSSLPRQWLLEATNDNEG